MITQKELAARLGISRTTIARAINNSPNIKLERKNFKTCKRIRL